MKKEHAPNLQGMSVEGEGKVVRRWKLVGDRFSSRWLQRTRLSKSVEEVGLEVRPGQATRARNPQEEEYWGPSRAGLKQEIGGCSVNQGRYLS